MSTKVKGDKIKEGSIPLSALSIEVKDKIENAGGADWNAQKGEAGYIENKPFRFVDAYANEYKFTNPLKREDFIPEVDEYGGVYKYKKSIDADYLQYVVCNKKTSEYGNLYDTAYYPVERTGNRFYVNLSEYGGYVYITEEYNEEADYNNYWLIVEVFHSNAFFPENSVYVIDSYEDLVTLETLSEYYLPDTVLKTTPQTLHTSHKNQALTNLGIADLLEALKPVQLSGEPPIGNVTQEQLDEIGLTEKVINNIVNGYTNRIYFNNSTYIVMLTSNNDESKEIVFGSFAFENGNVNAYTQFIYRKILGEITIEIEDF